MKTRVTCCNDIMLEALNEKINKLLKALDGLAEVKDIKIVVTRDSYLNAMIIYELKGDFKR